MSRYASEKISGDFLIDVCDQDGLKILLQQIEQETSQFVNTITKRLDIFEKSALEDAKRKLEESQNNSK